LQSVNVFQLRTVVSRLLSKKSFHTSQVAQIQKVEEVRIPVPWGHVAGKPNYTTKFSKAALS
jgi:hypothetical protein